jgi:hypothetical protein
MICISVSFGHPHFLPVVCLISADPTLDCRTGIHWHGTCHDLTGGTSVSSLCQVDEQTQVLEKILWYVNLQFLMPILVLWDELSLQLRYILRYVGFFRIRTWSHFFFYHFIEKKLMNYSCLFIVFLFTAKLTILGQKTWNVVPEKDSWFDGWRL